MKTLAWAHERIRFKAVDVRGGLRWPVATSYISEQDVAKSFNEMMSPEVIEAMMKYLVPAE
jgi:hypothetical protein